MFFLFLWFLFPLTGFSASALLTNGEKISGELILYNPQDFSLYQENRVFLVEKSRVRFLVFSDAFNPVLASASLPPLKPGEEMVFLSQGKTLKGRVLSLDSQSFTLDSAQEGILTFKTHELAAIAFSGHWIERVRQSGFDHPELKPDSWYILLEMGLGYYGLAGETQKHFKSEAPAGLSGMGFYLTLSDEFLLGVCFHSLSFQGEWRNISDPETRHEDILSVSTSLDLFYFTRDILSGFYLRAGGGSVYSDRGKGFQPLPGRDTLLKTGF